MQHIGGEAENMLMKELRYIWLIICLMLLLPACAAGQPGSTAGEPSQDFTWQEQYDLGVRYLSEGNYQEAILAFTAAIDIDPKQAPAYIGRGDAYVKSGETEENLTAAKTDYEKAIELDETSPEAYLGLADVYILQGNYEKALEILKKGLEQTGGHSVEEKLSEVENAIQAQETPGVKQYGGKGTVAFSGTGHNMSLSLTYPGLPKEVWVTSDEYKISARFSISISNGRTTFKVFTDAIKKEAPSGMVAVPGGCGNVLSVAHEYDAEHWVLDHMRTPVAVSRNDDTLTWNFTMPEQGVSVSDIQYIGYEIFYHDAPFSFGDGSYSVQERATFQLQGGKLVYLNDKPLENMGFLISEEEARQFWGN